MATTTVSTHLHILYTWETHAKLTQENNNKMLRRMQPQTTNYLFSSLTVAVPPVGPTPPPRPFRRVRSARRCPNLRHPTRARRCCHFERGLSGVEKADTERACRNPRGSTCWLVAESETSPAGREIHGRENDSGGKRVPHTLPSSGYTT